MVGLMAFGVLGSGLVYLMAAQPAADKPADQFQNAIKLQEQGNFKGGVRRLRPDREELRFRQPGGRRSSESGGAVPSVAAAAGRDRCIPQ